MDCPACKHSNPAENNFCGACGTQLAVERAYRAPTVYTPRHLAEKILNNRSALEGEKKQVTVAFVDIKESMVLASKVDAEQWHEILDGFFQILTDRVHASEGTINQYTGDGVMALFGAPIAHEDHASRACFAALELLDAMRDYSLDVKRVHGLDLAVRIGLNSGEVVVGRIGDDLRMDYTAQGQTVGLAQRMEALAEPNACYLSRATARLVSDFFELEGLGSFYVRGFDAVQEVFALRGQGSARSRLDVSRRRGFSRFVGREKEIDLLERSLEETLAGNGHMVGLVAAAGTGKSRVCHEFLQRCVRRGIVVNRAQCSVHGRNIDYQVARALMRDVFGVNHGFEDYDARKHIAGELALLDGKFHSALPGLFDFLGIADRGQASVDPSPEARQRRLLGLVRDLTVARSREAPVVLFVDDMHWSDASSSAFLAELAAAARDTRTLCIAAYRPGYSAPWMEEPTFQELQLEPLEHGAVAEMLADQMGQDVSVRSLPNRIYERSGGNPFFVEEIVQSLIESGRLQGRRGAYRLAAPLSEIELPDGIHSVLASRIDRLADREKRLLQLMAVVGKECSHALLERIAGLPTRELSSALSGLVAGEFFYQSAPHPAPRYAFRHSLTQEVAYGSQLSERRARAHAEVARGIEELAPDRHDENAALIAHHRELSGDAEAAALWHRRAAVRCGVHDPGGALFHWQRVRTQLAQVEEVNESVRFQLEAVLGILGSAWQQGMKESEAGEVYREGQELSVRVADMHSRMLMAASMARFYSIGGQPVMAKPIAAQAIDLANLSGDSELMYIGHSAAVTVEYHLGFLQSSIDRCDELFRLGADVLGWSTDADGISPAFWLALRGLALTHMGRLDEAHASITEARSVLEEVGNDWGLSWATGIAAYHAVHAGRPEEAMVAADQALRHAEHVGTHVALAIAHQYRGLALLAGGQARAAVDSYEEAVRVARTTGGFLTREADILAGLSESCLAAGQVERAATAAGEACEAAAFRGTPVHEIEARLAACHVALAGSLDDSARNGALKALDRATYLVELTDARLYCAKIDSAREALDA